MFQGAAVKFIVTTTYIDRKGQVTCVKIQEEPLKYFYAPVKVNKVKEFESGFKMTRLETSNQTLNKN